MQYFPIYSYSCIIHCSCLHQLLVNTHVSPLHMPARGWDSTIQFVSWCMHESGGGVKLYLACVWPITTFTNGYLQMNLSNSVESLSNTNSWETVMLTRWLHQWIMACSPTSDYHQNYCVIPICYADFPWNMRMLQVKRVDEVSPGFCLCF